MSLTKEEIIEGNRLIAEFFGLIYWVEYEGKVLDLAKSKEGLATGTYRLNKEIANEFNYTTTENYYKKILPDLPFISSWDWIIPVVEQFDALEIKPPHFHKHYFFCSELEHLLCRYEKIPVWEKLVQGIKWYNQNVKS